MSGSRLGRGPWRLYGARPGHLLAVAGALLLAAYAVSRLVDDPVVLRIAAWFVGAAVAWDLLLGPALAGADRLLRRVLRPVRGVSPLNHVRVPALVSLALLVVFAPSVLRRAEAVYAAKSGLSQEPYLGRWLAVTAVLAVASAVAFGVAVARAGRRDGDT